MLPIDLLYKQLDVYEKELIKANCNMGVYLCPRAKKELEELINRYKLAIEILK